MSIIRSVIAVLAGLGLISLVVEPLEFTLVNAVSGGQVSDMPGYFAIRNQPGILAAKLVYNTLAAILGGYLVAKVAQTKEMRHAAVAAAAQTLSFLWGFTVGEFAAFTPLWMRVALIVLSGPAILLGASIRARASQASYGPT